MNQLQRFFNYQGQQVRTLIRDGEPWFVARDVCEILEISNSRDAVGRLDDDEKDAVALTDTIGRLQTTTIISESGLYALVLSSRKPEAREFQRWIRKEVIPEIRKTGSYSIEPNQAVQRYLSLSEEDRAIAYFSELKQRKLIEQQLQIAAPKAQMFDVIASAENYQPMNAVAKSFNWGRNKLFEFLREQKVLRHNNEPYQEYIDRGYFKVRQVPIAHADYVENKIQTLVSAKGIEFIGRLLQKHGLLKKAE